MVECADQVRRIVRATRYAPDGTRGVGAALARASGFGAIGDYLTTANQQVCVIVQLESRAGLAALDAILQVEEVDGVFIGPADLAADMGYPGQTEHPHVREVVLDALRRTRAAGRAAGVLATTPEFLAASREAGATFLGAGIDVTLLAQSLRTLARTCKAADD